MRLLKRIVNGFGTVARVREHGNFCDVYISLESRQPRAITSTTVVYVVYDVH